MAKEKSPERRVRNTPRARVIWCRLFEAEAMEEGNDKSFSVGLLFKGGKNLKALYAAEKAAIRDKWGDKPPKRLKSPFRDGSDFSDDYDYIDDDDVIIVARRYEKYGAPAIVDQNVEPIESPSEFYSGCWAIADIEFYGYDRTSAKGVAVILNCIQKVKDDEPLGGGKVDPKDSFKPVETDDDDDDDDDDDRRNRQGRGKPRRARDEDDDDDDVF